jgi:hypothetical protein
VQNKKTNNKQKQRRFGRKVISLFEISLLVTLTIAISVMMGGEVKAEEADLSKITSTGGILTSFAGLTNKGTANGLTTYLKGNDWVTVNSQNQIVGGTVGGKDIGWATSLTKVASIPAPTGVGNFPINEFTLKSATKVGTTDLGVGTYKFDSATGKWGVNNGAANIELKEIPGAATGVKASPEYMKEHPIKGAFGGQAFGGDIVGSLFAGVLWAGVAYGAVKLLGSFFGMSKNLQSSLEKSLAAGGFVAGTINGLINSGKLGFATNANKMLWVGGTGLAVAALVFVLTYKDTKQKVVSYTCEVWEPPIGGSDCEKCNNDIFRPCSEYRCKALGQACQLLNPGTGKEKCAWVNPKDVNSPIITPLESLLNSGLKYASDGVRPMDRGVKIVNPASSDGCLDAFTKLQFGVGLNEPAKCRADFTRANLSGATGFNSLGYEFGGEQYFLYNHTQIMVLPNAELNSSGGMLLKNGNTMSVYTKCMDANGNVNEDDYVFTFCVKKGPDTTPPVIEGTSIISGSFVQYNADVVPVDVYTNEPAQCKWDRIDRDYSEMENNMSCASQASDVNSVLSYTCSGNLTGVRNMEDNKYFFKCKDYADQSGAGENAMTQSYPFILKGSQPLVMDDYGPNETVSGSTTNVNVTLFAKTSAGAEEGIATCYFSDTGAKDSYVLMYNTNSYVSTQSLDLTEGTYNYYLRCIDAGGNAVEANTSFNVRVDKDAPKVTRVYKQGDDALQIVTDEDAECVYSLTSCSYNFNEGITEVVKPNLNIGNVLLIKWESNRIYYIKCRDLYGTEPSPNECSLVASPTNF